MDRRTQGDMAFAAGLWPLDPDKSTLVFIHGAGGSAETWAPQVEGLSDRANTIAVDLPGHGQSKGPGREKVIDYARVVMELIEDIGAPDWDVFDSDGRFMGVVTMPNRFAPRAFVGHRIYGVWRDELDVQYVVRLRIVGVGGEDTGAVPLASQ